MFSYDSCNTADRCLLLAIQHQIVATSSGVWSHTSPITLCFGFFFSVCVFLLPLCFISVLLCFVCFFNIGLLVLLVFLLVAVPLTSQGHRTIVSIDHIKPLFLSTAYFLFYNSKHFKGIFTFISCVSCTLEQRVSSVQRLFHWIFKYISCFCSKGFTTSPFIYLKAQCTYCMVG